MEQDYNPIDYRKWIECGKGKNILDSLSGKHFEIWKKAFPYLDSRNDKGHAEIVAYFGLRLLESIHGKAEVVIPASIMHDIGWNIDPDAYKEARKTVYSQDYQKLCMEHQIRGVRLAFQILHKVRYPKKYIGDILEIIADHDTRFSEPANDNEKIVRDCDTLWRFTKPCITTYLSGKSAQEVFDYIQGTEFKRTERAFSIPLSNKIAKLEFVNTMVNLFFQDAQRVLEKEFPRELERIVAFYE